MMHFQLAGSGVMSAFYPHESELSRRVKQLIRAAKETTGGVMRNEIAINHQMLRAAQNKAVIARFIGDSKMWLEANKAMKSAINLPWYRRK
ncbi:putative host killing protein [Escherichia coli]|nr:putative host killing protein [Escherichia coli]